MKKYKSIKQTLNWKEILPKTDSEISLLLNNGEDDYVLAWGLEQEFVFNSKQGDSSFKNFMGSLPDEYLFGYLAYDLKNELEGHLQSNNEDKLNFEDAYFFQPEHILFRKKDSLIYYGSSSVSEIESLFNKNSSVINSKNQDSVVLKSSIKKEEYIKNVEEIQKHIQQGDIYEMNYCVNYSAVSFDFSAFRTYIKLSTLTEAPFSVYANFKNHSILSASPERFIKKSNNTITSQPIKGTAKRGQNPQADKKIALGLEEDEKERSENIMIVDLVRNDLSKIALPKTVRVDALCELHSFKTVHQLISTISCEIKKDISRFDIVEALFPMGSMTGAPKISAMEIIEKQENFKRGLYSGSIGYFDPNGNFDFNVVIRSILHNKENGTVSCSVGGAITSKSNPEKEYQECILKLDALKDAIC